MYHNCFGSNPSLTIFNSTAPLGTPNWIILRYFNIVGSTIGSLGLSSTTAAGSELIKSSVLPRLSVVLVLICPSVAWVVLCSLVTSVLCELTFNWLMGGSLVWNLEDWSSRSSGTEFNYNNCYVIYKCVV